MQRILSVSPFQMKLIGLMRQYGFLYDPVTRLLRSKGIPGFTSSESFGGCFKGALDAAEYLIAIIREDRYYSDLDSLRSPQP